ncbi:MAG: DUF1905 domain-containing protein [Acidobacteria bacterium]|nr:DUF1905 domain-containing protein [Acidobacteriota bacterium]
MARIQRKDPKLPRFIVVPSMLVADWGVDQNVTVTGELNGVNLGRRSLKRWDAERWFIQLPEPICKKANVDTGDMVTVTMQIAEDE